MIYTQHLNVWLTSSAERETSTEEEEQESCSKVILPYINSINEDRSSQEEEFGEGEGVAAQQMEEDELPENYATLH